MTYRVCIPTAGLGSRLGNRTRFVNKSLVSLGHRPIISHIIEQFSDDAEFVVALGYKGQLVREYLSLAYPRRQFYFAEVSPFEGPEAGLGLSLLRCKDYLQEPFYFVSCDTLVRDSIPDLSHNWMGYAERNDVTAYRTLRVCNDLVQEICEKSVAVDSGSKVYIGLAGIVDWAMFWSEMERGKTEAIRIGEAFGLRPIVSDKKVRAFRFDWYDTGNAEALALAEEKYGLKGGPNILEKENEAIWFCDKKVIKFSTDVNFIKGRVHRSKLLYTFVPEVSDFTEHMYCYGMVNGEILSKAANISIFQKLLDHAETFWTIRELNAQDNKRFEEVCRKFYKDKTLERVNLFYSIFAKTDNADIVNGAEQPSLDAMLKRIDWEWLSSGIPGRFHGDFHFENILSSNNGETFHFLDWRQNFGGLEDVGDIYYDLAKLLHGLIVSHEVIVENGFEVQWEENVVTFSLQRKQMLIDCEQFFYNWLDGKGYSCKKVRILTGLIYLNIAALHHYPYCLLLYALGKSMIWKELDSADAELVCYNA